MLVKMSGKDPKHQMRIALGVHRPGEVGDQDLDGHADSPDILLGTIPAASGVLAQEIADRFQLA